MRLYKATSVVTTYFATSETDEGKIQDLAEEFIKDEIEANGFLTENSTTTFSPVNPNDRQVVKDGKRWAFVDDPNVYDVQVAEFLSTISPNPTRESTVAGLSTP